MADVFLSYKREDQEIARGVAADLEAEGFSVFFDVRIDVGDSWDERIERELNAAKACVVLWSAKSRESPWVRREAREANNRKILCPAMVGNCKVPLEFSDVQAANLVGRRAGDLAHEQWRKLCHGVGRCVGRLARGPVADGVERAIPAAAPAPAIERGAPNRRALIASAAVVGAAAVGGGGYFGWTQWQASQTAAQAAERARQASAAWAQARATNTRAAIAAFLRDFPDAAEVAEARRAMAVLPLVVRQVLSLEGDDRAILVAAFNSDGSQIATGGQGGVARIWDTASGAQAASFRAERPIWSIAMTPNHRQIAIGFGGLNDINPDVEFRSVDALSQVRATLTAPGGFGVDSLAFSPDGALVLGASARSAFIWNCETLQTLTSMSGHLDSICSASFSPNGAQILTASSDSSARIWDTASGRQLMILATGAVAELPGGRVPNLKCAAFDASGTRVVTTDDQLARLWDVTDAIPDDQRQLGELRGDAANPWDYIRTAFFNHDGQRVITAAGSTRIWDTQSRQVIAELPGSRYATFSPDGTKLLILVGRMAQVWTIDEFA